MPMLDMDRNQWVMWVGHRGCISPCSGRPVLKTEPGPVGLDAHRLPVFLQCSGCGYAPGADKQPELIKRFLIRLLEIGDKPSIGVTPNGQMAAIYPVRQPDGQIAIFSNITENFVFFDLTIAQAAHLLGDEKSEEILGQLHAIQAGLSPVDGWKSWAYCFAWAIHMGHSLDKLSRVVARTPIDVMEEVDQIKGAL